MQDELQKEYERGFIDGMQKQMQSSVDKAVNAMAQSEEDVVPLKIYKELSALCTRQSIRLMEYESQYEQKPVAWIYNAGTENRITFIDPHPIRQDVVPLYTAPPQREWTDDEFIAEAVKRGHYTAEEKKEWKSLEADGESQEIWLKVMEETKDKRHLPVLEFAVAIEAKLKEKNGG